MGAYLLKYLRRYLELALGAGLIIALDQWSKHLVRTELAFGQSVTPIPALGSILRIVHWSNTGAAFGVFPDGGRIIAVIAVIVVVGILFYYPRLEAGHFWLRLALMLQLGGAIGNLIDRITRGPVTDFVAVGPIPVFNVADAAISCGVAVLVLTMWLEERQQSGTGLDRAGDPPDGDGAMTEFEQSMG
ncbi:MAG TPA: signal peptidase II [Anaerolineales bacterium]|jgi:signal peptidase II